MTTQVSRRGFMKLSASSAAVLSMGSGLAMMTGCSRQPDSNGGYTFLTADDIEFVNAIAPVILLQAYPASLTLEDAQLRLTRKLDELINTLQQYSKDQLSQLFGIMSSAPLRLAVGAPVGGWKDAPAEDIESFLNSWKDSSLAIKNMGYASLCKLVTMCWYSQPESFIASGYPGPPKKIPMPV